MYYKQVTSNKKAYHNYFIEEKLEAGIELFGSEVKSLRSGHGTIQEAYISIKDTQIFLINAHIPKYKYATYDELTPTRERRLLLHKKEIIKLKQKLAQKGYTAVPLKIYFKGNFAKVEIGLAKGKHTYDKRASLKEKQQKREMSRVIKSNNYS